MSRVDAAAASDRLPWLSDEPETKAQPARRATRVPVAWAAATLVTVVGGAFWFGVDRGDETVRPPAPKSAQTVTTVPLPEARPVTPEVRLPAETEVTPAPAPEIRSVRPREVPISPPRREPRESAPAASRETPSSAEPAVRAPPPPAMATPSSVFIPPRPWDPHNVQGAAGRLVQIGAFGSVTQAKRGWWHMVRYYPAMGRLPALVRPTRNSHGRTFYRFRVGTTSQAHSEILCQRMQRISFSCAVIDLPGKAKVER